MISPRLVRLDPRPRFDPAAFARTAQAGELTPDLAARMGALWPRFTEAVNAWRIEAEDGGVWLLLWLDETLEREVEARFAASPLFGFLEHALAVHAVMAAAALVEPALAEHGCAPVPAPHPAVAEAARRLGLSWPEKDTMNRRYALLTALPFGGGCAGCVLARDCPRLRSPRPS